jgi:hypothetical protein
MMRFLLRFLGLCSFAGGFFFFVYDGTKSIADKSLYFTKVGDVWAWVHQDSLTALQPAITRSVGAWLWDPFVVTLLAAPASLLLALLGTMLILLGRKKKPLIGYARS